VVLLLCYFAFSAVNEEGDGDFCGVEEGKNGIGNPVAGTHGTILHICVQIPVFAVILNIVDREIGFPIGFSGDAKLPFVFPTKGPIFGPFVISVIANITVFVDVFQRNAVGIQGCFDDFLEFCEGFTFGTFVKNLRLRSEKVRKDVLGEKGDGKDW